MAARSKIEWTDASWTPIRARHKTTGKVGWHCEHVSEGCRNCYAETMNRRLGTGLDFKPGTRADLELFLDEKILAAPLSWRKPRMIFVCSMTDLFGDWIKEEWLNRMFAVMALCPGHTFQVLTKRPERMREYLADHYGAPHGRIFTSWVKIAADHFGFGFNEPQPLAFPLPNVWLGASCEDQTTADARIPELLATPAAVRFVSCEPMLGPIDLAKWLAVERINLSTGPHMTERTGEISGLGWVICGGESGHGARPMHPYWAQSLRDQCVAAGILFFLKQRGEWTWIDDGDYDADRFPTHPYDWREKNRGIVCMRSDGSYASGLGGDSAEFLYRVGKKRAGRLLDGIEHNGFPER